MNTEELSAAGIENYRELVNHGTSNYPMQVYINRFDSYSEHQIGWHWHPELELTAVISGEVEITVNNVGYKLTAGEGFFINTNVMHKQAAVSGSGEYPVLATICFLPDFIGDCGGDLIYRKYVMPLIGSNAPRCLKLQPQTPWQLQIIELIQRVFDISEGCGFGYELRCRNAIGELWYVLAANIGENSPRSADRKTLINEKRLKEMMSYIYGNYQNEVTVENIARAANIGKSECFRCFRSMIGKKPIAFLNEYRLKKASELLATTDMQITEVCMSCGFGHISYFGKMFRTAYGMSPREYRNARAADRSQDNFQ